MRRKGSQNGTVRTIGKRWYVQFSRWERDDNGNLTWKRTERAMERDGKPILSVGAEKVGRREAERLAYELYVGPANSRNRIPQGYATVSEFVEHKFRPDHMDKLKKSGRDHYEYFLRAHILPTLGPMQLGEVDADLVQQLLTAKGKVYSTQTVTHIRNAISALFRHARRLKFYEGQLPTEDLKTAPVKHKERRALRWDQVLALTEKLTRFRDKQIVLLLAQTGLRIGEAAGLLWKCINFEDDFQIRDGIAVPPNSTCVRYNWTRGERTDLKGTDKVRLVPLTAETWVGLQLLRERSKWCGDEQPVFATRAGSPIDAHNVSNRQLKVAAASIGLPWISWHVLRHTAATLGDTVGLTPAEKMKILGHQTAAMSIRYSHPELDTVRAKLETITAGKQRKALKAS